MATLYEIDQAILDCIDQETGEIVDPEKLNDLQMERNSKIENVALWLKNLESDAEAFKNEKNSFAEKEKAAKNKIEGLKNWLSLALNGQKMQTSKVQISFRKSEAIEIEDEARFINFARTNGRDDLLSYKEPTINKTEIKKAIKAGQTFDGVELVEKNNIQVK